MNNQGYAYDWNDTITKDAEQHSLLAPGNYPFEVMGLERGRHDGSARLPACPKATLKLRVSGRDAYGNECVTTITHSLFLHSTCEASLSAFFSSIGLKKKGEQLIMRWDITGARGFAKVIVDEYKNRDGEDRQNNKIKYFYSPEEADELRAKSNLSAPQNTASNPQQYAQSQPVQQHTQPQTSQQYTQSQTPQPQPTQPAGWQPQQGTQAQFIPGKF